MAISSDKIADILTIRDIAVERLAEGERQKVVAMLRGLKQEVSEKIRVIDPASPVRLSTRERRLLRLDGVLSEILGDTYGDIAKQTRAINRRLAEDEARFLSYDLGEIVAEASGPIFPTVVPSETLRTLADDALVEGAPAREWWKKQASNTRDKFMAEMRKGISAGESVSSLVDRFSKQVMTATYSNAEALVRTSAASVQNAARFSVYKANKDRLRGLQALTTLDSRTSAICRARAGMAWSLNGRPLKGTTLPWIGPPPWHYNCRTRLIPILVGAELAGDLGYDPWLKRQPAAVQLKVLGRTRYEMWNKGKISVSDMVSQKGRPLTIEQLEQRAA